METETKIITVTLSPSLDRTMVTHYLGTGYHNQTQEPTRLDPAGEGLNIARALCVLGPRTHAVVVLGDDATARAFKALAAAEPFEITIITVPGQTRSNTIILDTGTKEETQITEAGQDLEPEDIDRVAAALQEITTAGDVVVLAGPLPAGAPEDSYARLTETVQACGALAAVVRIGPALAATLAAGPDLVGLTELEMEGYFNLPVREVQDFVACARKLRTEGAGRVLVERLSVGDALLVADETVVRVTIPEAEGGTTSGVWEALVAGYLAGRAAEQPMDEALQLGAAAANYAAAQVGSEFGSLEEVRDFAQEMDSETNADPGSV
ncbi:MAG TPA: PfkB family carbohydrate kinase [Anaerolineales bacterium]|nr:PfkB family carbohydrate kinase [Anaerolineales bacterium]